MSDVSEEKPSRLEPPRVSRRSFLSLASLGSFFAAMGVAAAGVFRLPNPTVLPGPVRRFKIGQPEEYPVGGERQLEKENVYVFRDAEGVYAISAICTHLGCQRKSAGGTGAEVAALAGGQPGGGWPVGGPG
jgi:cytochrome b6-f complex iron-sulfur subunit